jgi:hypothetical protein
MAALSVRLEPNSSIPQPAALSTVLFLKFHVQILIGVDRRLRYENDAAFKAMKSSGLSMPSQPNRAKHP